MSKPYVRYAEVNNRYCLQARYETLAEAMEAMYKCDKPGYVQGEGTIVYKRKQK